MKCKPLLRARFRKEAYRKEENLMPYLVLYSHTRLVLVLLLVDVVVHGPSLVRLTRLASYTVHASNLDRYVHHIVVESTHSTQESTAK